MKGIEQLHNEIQILKENNIDTDELVRIADAIEREVEECYALLPKDARGEYVHVGDEMECRGCGREWFDPFVVVGMEVSADGWVAYAPDGGGHYPTLLRHKRPTVEEMLEDALNRAAHLDREEGYWPSAADITNIVNEVAPMLRLKEEE